MKMAHVAKFYSGKNILVTGATGYLGTGLVEKLLRSFPQIDKIYNMIRPGSGESVEERTSKYFERKAFMRYIKTGNHTSSRVKWIQCDFGQPDLNLAEEDVSSILENVNVIIHCASLMNFKAPLRQAAAGNITGTRALLEIARKCKNLESFVYVSSAYTNTLKNGDVVDETLGPYRADINEIFEKLKKYDDATLKVQFKDWIDQWGNTYVLTKNATEGLVHDYGKYIPVGVYRPGSVLHACAEPYAYWQQSQDGFMKVLPYLRYGVKFPCSDSMPMICVPVDICVNGLIAAAYNVAKESNVIKFYNCTNSNNLITSKDSFNYFLDGMRSEGVYPPDSWETKTKYRKENEEVEKLAYAVKHLTHSNFTWINGNFESLWKNLEVADKELLFCDINAMNWKSFFQNMYKHTKINRISIV